MKISDEVAFLPCVFGMHLDCPLHQGSTLYLATVLHTESSVHLFDFFDYLNLNGAHRERPLLLLMVSASNCWKTLKILVNLVTLCGGATLLVQWLIPLSNNHAESFRITSLNHTQHL